MKEATLQKEEKAQEKLEVERIERGESDHNPDHELQIYQKENQENMQIFQSNQQFKRNYPNIRCFHIKRKGHTKEKSFQKNIRTTQEYGKYDKEERRKKKEKKRKKVQKRKMEEIKN